MNAKEFEMLYGPCHEAGGMTAYEWERDPKRLGFILARYKFVSKMLEGYGRVLEVGCADGFGSRVVAQTVGKLVAVDLDEESIEEAKRVASSPWPVDFRVHDLTESPFPETFNAAYCLDVLEHIDPIVDEQSFLEHLRACAPVAIIGMPSLESQPYASELSAQGHINCKTGPQLRATLLRHWQHVFLFGMNDETLHTGFSPMCQYRLAVCT